MTAKEKKDTSIDESLQIIYQDISEKLKVKTTEQVLQSYSLKFATLKSDDIINLEIEQDEDVQKVLMYLRSNLK